MSCPRTLANSVLLNRYIHQSRPVSHPCLVPLGTPSAKTNGDWPGFAARDRAWNPIIVCAPAGEKGLLSTLRGKVAAWGRLRAVRAGGAGWEGRGARAPDLSLLSRFEGKLYATCLRSLHGGKEFLGITYKSQLFLFFVLRSLFAELMRR
jgi:hypothetical protein